MFSDTFRSELTCARDEPAAVDRTARPRAHHHLGRLDDRERIVATAGFNSFTASLVMTAVSVWSPIRSRT